jgi:hypothetical protein
MYHKCSFREGVPKKCCLYHSGAIWNRGWQPDIWLVNTFSPSPEQLQVEPSDVPDMFLYSLCHMNHFSKIWYLFFIWPFLSIFNWKSNTILHHKVNDPYFIFSLGNLNEWIRRWFSVILCVSNGTPSYFHWFIKKGLKILHDVNRRRTDNQMVKWKRTKWQTIMWNTLRRKLSIE